MVSGCVRAPSSMVTTLPSQSLGARYVGTPSWWNCSRSATPPDPRVPTNEAVTRSGSAPRTVSSDGLLSASRGTVSLAAARSARTGSVHVAVPTMRSASPSDSRISVELWFRDTARCGGDSTTTSRPQFCTASGYPVSPGSPAADGGGSATLPQPTTVSRRTNSVARQRTAHFLRCQAHSRSHPACDEITGGRTQAARPIPLRVSPGFSPDSRRSRVAL